MRRCGLGERGCGIILALVPGVVVHSSLDYTAHATAGRVLLQARERIHRTA